MDWAKQTEEMFKMFSENQQKMWESWQENVRQGVSAEQAGQAWKQAVETWQKTVESVLAAQGQWADTWADSFDAKNATPEEMAQWIEKTQEMVKQWNAAQQKLWTNWFDMAKKAEVPTAGFGNWAEEGQKAFDAWQETTKKVMDAQMQWFNTWTANSSKK